MELIGRRSVRALLALLAGTCAMLIASGGAAAAGVPVKRVWLPGYADPATPPQWNRVGVIEVGRRHAANVLVLEPGTSAGAAYFLPFSKWLVEKLPGWQVWSVERRENLLEDQSQLRRFKRGEVTPQQFFHYYLGYLGEGGSERHFEPSHRQAVERAARGWGMNVAVEDLHVVIEAAKALGGKVVLGGHSLGGSVVTAYATWDFAGTPGADGLSGLVYDDGGSGPAPISVEQAQAALERLQLKSPWLVFGGIPAPTLGVFGMVGAALAALDPNEPSLLAKWGGLPASLRTRNGKGEEVIPTNEAGFGYGIDVGSSPPNLIAAQAHVGEGIAEGAPGQPWVWNANGALTPLARYADMLAGIGLDGVDGEEWYFPERLTIDTGAVAEGNANPAQATLGEHAIHGSELPASLHILAINSELDKVFSFGGGTLADAETLAAQSHIPSANLTLVDVEDSYAHNDPAGAYPNNELMSHLVPFLEGL